MSKSFASEAQLVRAIVASPEFRNGLGYENWRCCHDREVDGFFGVPDLVVAFGKCTRSGSHILRTFAFEAKRQAWRRAVTQAYRYAAFADYVYVVLDRAHAAPAKEGIDVFKRSNVGLTTVDVDGSVTWVFRPRHRPPYATDIRIRLNRLLREAMFAGTGGEEPNNALRLTPRFAQRR